MSRQSRRDLVRAGIRSLALAWPATLPTPSVDDDLADACRLLDARVDPQELTTAAAVLGIAIGVVAFAGTLLVAPGTASTRVVALAGAVAVALGSATDVLCRRLPVLVATGRRRRAAADAATVVSSLALSLRLSPVPERAVRFAATVGDGPLQRSLRRHGDRAAVAGRTDGGLGAFGSEWAEWVPGLDRSLALLVDALDADTEADRARLLDRAVHVVEERLRDRAASFAGDLRGPVTGLYAFGVLLPLALVGTVPAAAAAGVRVPPLAFVVVYDLLLPGGLVVAAVSLLRRRPVSFPAPRVRRSHPAVPDRRPHALAAGVLAVAVGWLLARALLGTWAAPVLAGGAGLGVGALVLLRPAREVRRAVDERERALGDALTLLGRRVGDGDSVEHALPQVATDLSGPVGDALTAASRRRDALGCTVGDALAGEGGPFGPSRAVGPRSTAAVAFVCAAVSEGRTAGPALVDHAERLDALAACERAAQRELATVTNTLRDTAALYGPLVGGASVALAGRLDGLSGTGGAASALAGAGGAGEVLSVGIVGPAVGGYVLALAAVLTALATGLERGLDVTVVGYRVGIALVTASSAFVAGHVAVAALVG
ncbi:type II secretion system protein [Halobaculum marinum]|uniref:Type II secretion system protein n=1 Tax=Halobaculum marinum TaxID=3031996 RepID=A0ABD5X1J6_9EURY|nr:type II secretion system protein [Halobaculum sp. DT55]